MNLHDKEKDGQFQLKTFLKVHESAHKQKSRTQWLKLGDSNSKFFFSAMKERYAKNGIDVLYDNTGKKLTTTYEIKEEIRGFYKDLIGTASPQLTSIDIEVVRKGKKLSQHCC